MSSEVASHLPVAPIPAPAPVAVPAAPLFPVAPAFPFSLGKTLTIIIGGGIFAFGLVLTTNQIALSLFNLG